MMNGSSSEARTDKDERHICPLQLGTIERCIRLWSNPGDTVLSPFAGIGSEGYQALKLGRRFVGIELKKAYYQTALKNLEVALKERDAGTLFEAVI
jgi:DNA modification methylase